MKDKYQTVGWQHFKFKIPSEWDLVKEYGHQNKGYLRYDDLDQARLELKWNRVKNSFKLLDFVTKHALEIGWENSPLKKLSNDNSIFSIENRNKDINQEVIFIRPNQPKSRLAVFRMFYKINENGSKIVKNICNSFEENLNQPNSMWSYFDNSYELPSIYEKVDAQINAGNKFLTFNHRNKFVYVRTISLVSHFCPFKPITKGNINQWIQQILENQFNKELKLGQWDFLSNQVTTKTSFSGRFLLKNIFHFCHHWKIMASHDGQADILKIAIFNFRNEKHLKSFKDLKELVAIE
ncbi:MAG: hypothetical protein COA79_05285 [Planctomycetota bacterium]|nr:MAG: hypothetical protein COA79_05285 [Planctomycetota bacterium]